jgi:hypothetical protein
LPYKRNEAVEELMNAALRALRKAKHHQDLNEKLKSLKRVSDKLEHVNDHRKLCYG